MCLEERGGSHCLRQVLGKTDTTNNVCVTGTANCIRPEYKGVLHWEVTSINWDETEGVNR